ncbi:DUF7144 family membrane protein [Actinomycetospora sp. CA-101289]|uniref:DUF7144 family membrane protein n=1 Tax=Actinomycetospora sp. CA-101289 TaxID=3239893 RepID=UPI003D97B629
MTEQQVPLREGAAVPHQRTNDGRPRTASSSGGTGWLRFGGVVMTVIGAFAVLEGFVALFSPTYFVAVNQTVLAVDFTGWGWIHLLLGVLVLATGLSLLGSAPPWARGVGIGLVAINMVVQMAFLSAYPIWSIIVIALDVLVLYALVVTSDADVRGARA